MAIAAKPPPRAPFGSYRLAGYAMLLVLAIGIVQVVASILFYEAIDRQALYEDHARRVAELLIVGDRVHRVDPALTAQLMKSSHLDVTVAGRAMVGASGRGDRALADIRRHIMIWEPSLADRPLTLNVVRGERSRRDLVGSMQLHDGAWLNFRSRDISTGWPIVLRATVMTLAITLLCVGAGIFVLRLLTAPLHRLADAVSGPHQGHSLPLKESGPSDVRSIARSFNELQARIADLEDDQSRSFEAISHDLRTPLSRLKIASDFVSDSDVSRIVRSSADEMEALLMSLQRFLRAQHVESVAEPVDLVALVDELVAPAGDRVTLRAPEQAHMATYREPLALALDPLIENALHYGRKVEVAIERVGPGWRIEIADDGPGISEALFEKILDPFFRLDEARARDTDGFGLGIPTAHRLLQRFGGSLAFRNRPEGGLVVRVDVPLPERG